MRSNGRVLEGEKMEGIGCLFLVFAFFALLILMLFMGVGIPLMGLVSAIVICRRQWGIAAILVALSVYALTLFWGNDRFPAFLFGNTYPIGSLYFVQLMITAILMTYGYFRTKHEGNKLCFGSVIALMCGVFAVKANAIYFAISLLALIFG